MKKIFTILTGIIVCAALISSASAASLAPPPLTQTITKPGLAASASLRFLSASQTLQDIAEARNLLRSQALASGGPRLAVTLAALDPSTLRINLVSVAKDSFLTKGVRLLATTQLGNRVQLQVIRPNGVNTAVTVIDTTTGSTLLPLVVAYPIERNGAQIETA